MQTAKILDDQEGLLRSTYDRLICIAQRAVAVCMVKEAYSGGMFSTGAVTGVPLGNTQTP